MATVMSAVSLGLGLGPVAGGAIVEYLGWHVLFLVTAATLLLIPFLAGNVPAETPKKGSFDAIGAILIGIGTSGLLLFLTNHYLIALIAGLIALVLFAFRIRAAKNPFVLPALFANPQYLKVVAIGVIGYMCSFVTLFLLPQLLEHQYALKAVEAGFVIFPGSLLAMIVSRQVGRIIDTRGNLPILKYVPPFLLLAVVLFALLERTSYVTIIFLYMLLSVAFTFLSSSVSNEVSKILQPAQIGSGLGLLQLLQFFSGALGAALTASALGWQKNLMPAQAYSNIYWGLTIIAVLSIVSAVAYLRGRAARSL